MTAPYFIDLKQAQQVLSDMGIELNEKQIRRAAEPDGQGQRRLPFFVDPIDGKLKINKNTLVSLYIERQVSAENNMRITLG